MDWWNTTCRCCDTAMQGSDHCPECGCEEFEETCETKQATVCALMVDMAARWTAQGDAEDAAGALRALSELQEFFRERG